MAKLRFKSLDFEKKDGKVRFNFMRLFYFDVDENALLKIGEFKIKNRMLDFPGISEKKAQNKFNFLLSENIKHLKNKITNNPAVYIHKNSGVPLIGNICFGIIDRGTNCIEVKPVTGCNLNCIYCSISEGIYSKKRDFVIEKDYLVEEFKKVVEYKCSGEKNCNIEAHIGTHGEPLLYSELIGLIKDISKIPQVKIISIDTNGTLLTKSKVDEMIGAGLTRFNLSINALDPKLAKKIAGTAYNIEKIKEIAEYIAQKTELTIAPVLIPGINESEIGRLIEFAKKINKPELRKKFPIIGIQNFLNYKTGRNPVKQFSWDIFTRKLRELEKKHNIKLVVDLCGDYGIKKLKALPKPFRKGDVIEAEIVCGGRNKDEKIAVAKERTVSLPNCAKEGKVKVKIIRSKHNIFIGKVL